MAYISLHVLTANFKIRFHDFVIFFASIQMNTHKTLNLCTNRLKILYPKPQMLPYTNPSLQMYWIILMCRYTALTSTYDVMLGRAKRKHLYSTAHLVEIYIRPKTQCEDGGHCRRSPCLKKVSVLLYRLLVTAGQLPSTLTIERGEIWRVVELLFHSCNDRYTAFAPFVNTLLDYPTLESSPKIKKIANNNSKGPNRSSPLLCVCCQRSRSAYLDCCPPGGEREFSNKASAAHIVGVVTDRDRHKHTPARITPP